MNDVKKAVRKVLLRYQRERGTAVAIEVAKNSLKQYIETPDSVDGKSFHTDFNGEVCETVLEMLIDDYKKKHPQAHGWMFNRSLILSDPTKPRDNQFLTEIDLLLMTPQCFYVFECKSYSGDKTLYGDGKLIREKGNSCDVYKQNRMHLEVVQKWLDRLSNRPRYQMVMFDFSNGELHDDRSSVAKAVMPCVNELSFNSLFSGNLDAVWDVDVIKEVHRLFSSETDALRAKHLAYVKSLHASR